MLAPDVEELVVSYLRASGLSNVSVIMPPDPPMPFFLVNRISGGDDWVTDYPCVSIHCFATSRTLASSAARQMHTLMKNLSAKTPIPMSNGNYASVDYVFVVETPAWEDYADKNIHRYCGRYHIDLRVNLTT